MSDRERAREIVERLAYDEELDRNGQEALIATALAQVRAEALRRAAEAVAQRAVEVGRQECCGHGVGYGEYQECCGSPDFVITDRDAATAIRALAEGGE